MVEPLSEADGGGWLATFNYLGYLAGTVLVARVGDMQLKFRFYRIGLVLAVVSTGLMGTTTDMATWGVLRFVAGLSSTAGLLLASGLVLNWLLAHQRRPQLGLHFAGLGVGIAVSGLAAAAMADQLASSRQWIALGTLAVVFLIPAWAWMPPPAAISSATGANAPPPPGRRWRWLLIASYFCAGVGFVVSATFIVAILVLQKPALIALKDYEEQQARGRAEPVFDPRPLGIANAQLWEKIADKRKRGA